MIIDCISDLPPYHTIFISCNEHKLCYMSMNDYINEKHLKKLLSYEEAQKCLSLDSIWEVQVYPLTPVSFYKTAASTLDTAVKLMFENCREGKWI
jgi:hypothetical protein